MTQIAPPCNERGKVSPLIVLPDSIDDACEFEIRIERNNFPTRQRNEIAVNEVSMANGFAQPHEMSLALFGNTRVIRAGVLPAAMGQRLIALTTETAPHIAR